MLAIMLEYIFKLLIECTDLVANYFHGSKISITLVDVAHLGTKTIVFLL
jgi:hypothetical protein